MEFKVGSRKSPLAQIQTNQFIHFMNELFKKDHVFSFCGRDTPGDLDRTLSLPESPDDFFTKTLDEALLKGEIHCAVHSAKDLPHEKNSQIEVLFLPWREDSSDCWVISSLHKNFPQESFRVGVSSQRREDFVKKYFPQARCLPIRGNIQERLDLLDKGQFDVLIMATAALNRLNLKHRIYEKITLLEPHEDQGLLAVTFLKGDLFFEKLKSSFIPPVIFAGAGIGNIENVTQGVLNALKIADVILYDTLIPYELEKYFPQKALQINVGKRCGEKGSKQEEILKLILKYAQKSLKVVRLKGGDPTVFGRLAEEIEVLLEKKIPFEILPGLGALSVCAASSGFLPTIRGISRGFSVWTPRLQNKETNHIPSSFEKMKFPQIVYMGGGMLRDIALHLLNEGNEKETPVGLVFEGGTPYEKIWEGTLENLLHQEDYFVKDICKPHQAVLLFIGQKRFFKEKYSRKIGFAGSSFSFEKARHLARYRGFSLFPVVLLEPFLAENVLSLLEKIFLYDKIIISSPSCAKLWCDFIFSYKKIFSSPEIWVSGPQTAQVLEERGFFPEVIPQKDYGVKGILAEAQKRKPCRILRLKSPQAPSLLSQELSHLGYEVDDFIFYEMKSKIFHEHLSFCEGMIVGSASAADILPSFQGPCCGIGNPTVEKMKNLKEEKEFKNEILQSFEETFESAFLRLSLYFYINT